VGGSVARRQSVISFSKANPNFFRSAHTAFHFVIPSEARNLSSFEIQKREIPRFARNDKKIAVFRSLNSPRVQLSVLRR
jgi:hypothetical protein